MCDVDTSCCGGSDEGEKRFGLSTRGFHTRGAHETKTIHTMIQWQFFRLLEVLVSHISWRQQRSSWPAPGEAGPPLTRLLIAAGSLHSSAQNFDQEQVAIFPGSVRGGVCKVLTRAMIEVSIQ